MSTGEFISAAKVPYLKLLGYVKPYKKRFILGIVFGVFAGLFGGLMLFALESIFNIVLPGSNMKEPVKIPLLGIEVMPPSSEEGSGFGVVMTACAIIPLLMLIRGLLEYFNKYCMLWVGNKVIYDLRRDLFSKLINQSLDFYNNAKVGELIQTTFNQTRQAQRAAVSVASDLIKHPISILAIIFYLFYRDPIFAVSALVVFPIALLPVIIISKKVRKAGGKEEEEAGLLMVTMQESFSGIRVVKSHGRESFEEEKFDSASRKMIAFIMRWSKAIELVGPLVETVASLGIAFGLLYAWYAGMTAPQFFMLFIALIAMYPHAKSLSRIQILLQKCIIATTKVFDMMERVSDVEDSPEAKSLDNCNGHIRLDNVSFAYKKAKDKQALKNVSLEFEPGKSYALVGKSGAGKSTLFGLLQRFYDPVDGTIYVDGEDVKDYKQSTLRDHIGVVNQETFLFNTDIRENIRYGRLDATDEEVEEAAKKAFAHDFILEQPKGYGTNIGDKGCNLSGGQQQRLTIARAILRNAAILLLDEATSNLDTEAEKKIQAALEELIRGKTVIAIAHRLSTVVNSDKIIVMQDGEIHATGTHNELLKSCQLYKELYQAQFEKPTGF